MELKKISYKSALAFGFVALVLAVLFGIMLWYISNNAPTLAVAYGVPASAPFLMTVILGPLLNAIVYTLIMLLIIAVYNLVAKKYPLSWDVHK